MTPASGVDVVVLGDVMADTVALLETALVPDADNPAEFVQALGGQAANTAAWLAAAGSRVHLVAAVGADGMGTWVRERLHERGLPHSLATVDAPTGRCVVVTEPTGVRTMLPNSGANALIGRSDAGQMVTALLEGGARHLHLSGYVPLHDADFAARMVQLAKSYGASTSMDTPAVFAESTWAPVAVPSVDVLLGTAPELTHLLQLDAATPAALADCIADRFAGQVDRPSCVLVKAGARGAWLIAERTTNVPSVAASVVDTTGAGDAFTAGFLAAWTAGQSAETAADTASVLAARALTQRGGQPSSDEGQHGNL